MGTSFLTRWLSDQEIKAICWTLIHSLWIGVVIALLAGLLISFTRKSSANMRYRVLCGILVLFVIAIGITFYLEVRVVSSETPSYAINGGKFPIKQADVPVIYHLGALPQHQGVVSQAVGFLNHNMKIIFVVWLLFFILKSLKMVSGLLYIQRICSYRVHEVAEEFKHKIELFSNLIGIRQTVRLMQSELVKVPVAVGWLKPVILLPMGILLQLSPEQLESILWHELAHVRRRDYLVNILQGIVETVFFFNPGLLWLSSLIRAEREACCDDIVLSRTNRKANYLEALLSFGDEDNSKVSLAMGIVAGISCATG
jgi:beta-lactamase regulating signal transducer with metallopeptidase domain